MTVGELIETLQKFDHKKKIVVETEINRRMYDADIEDVYEDGKNDVCIVLPDFKD